MGQKLGFKHSKKTKLKMIKTRTGMIYHNTKGHCRYFAIHNWVRNQKGKPKVCIDCDKTYKERKLNWSNIDHKYYKNLDDYQARCIPCHDKYDLKNNHRLPINLINQKLK